MSSGLPATVDPIRLADTRAHLTGELSVKAMSRLREMCLDDQGLASVDLFFERSSERGLRQVRGTITAQLHVPCQRCLEQMTLALRVEPSLAFVKAGEHADIQGEETELLVVDKPISLSNLVEDELLLAMPMIPMHDVSECPAQRRLGVQDAAVQPSRENPFAVLGKLKQKTR